MTKFTVTVTDRGTGVDGGSASSASPELASSVIANCNPAPALASSAIPTAD
jgi:hypothetical protein